jgi:hypothetical protein
MAKNSVFRLGDKENQHHVELDRRYCQAALELSAHRSERSNTPLLCPIR